MKTLVLQPRWNAPATPFRHTWEEVINVDQFRWLSRHDLLAQLAQLRREHGAHHVRAVGMFDDELRVLRPGPETFGAPPPRPLRTNWQMIHGIWDGLLERGLRPMVTTTFVPSALASGPTTVFTTQGHTSPPTDYRAWGDLVTECTRQAVDRHGLAEVRKWYFEVWNEPNLQGWFWGADQAEFWRLWACTWRAIKSVDASLRVGGPSTARGEWLPEFLAYTARHDCRPDYLALHIYNNDGENGALAPFAGPQTDRAGTSPNFAAGVVRGARALAQSAGFRGEIHWNEWGRSWRPVEPDRESANEAAFIVRAMAEFSQEADQFAYWCVSDIYDQVGFGRETFHGNYGLLNLQGLRKPAYHAFTLLHLLGTQRVPLPDATPDALHGAIVTRSDTEARILVYAYAPDATMEEPLQVQLTLPPEAAGRPVLHRIDSRENNVLTRWRELGSPVYLHPSDRNALAAVDTLQVSPTPVMVEPAGDERSATFAMARPGVALLTVPWRPAG